MQIGNVKLENNCILAPMAGVTDLPFRLICKEMGCDLVVTEMVSAKAILYNNRNTIELLHTEESEKPVALQLFGSDPQIMADMAKRIEQENRGFSMFDINMGCPVPKIVNNGEGSALLKNPVLAGKIIESVSRAVTHPVTVKIRKGFDDDSVNAPEMAHVIEESGGAAVTVHGRTRQQFYSGKADWNIIAKVKESVKIPVIGNGDITCARDAKKMLELTGCDGFMIGRGARGNPWIFREIKYFFETGEELSRPGSAEIRDMILKHARLLVQYKGEYTGIREMRKHFAWYTAGLPKSASMRCSVNEVENMEQLCRLVEQII